MNPAVPTTSATIQQLRPRVERARSIDDADGLPFVLLRELQHRTANLLNTATLLLQMKARRSAAGDARSALQEVAAGFALLIEANKRFTIPDMDAVADAATEVRAACKALSRAYAAARPGIRFDCVIDEEACFHVRPAGVLSLIVNELVTNAFRHAFRDRDSGYLLITLAPAAHGRACLSVIDDGPGFATEAHSATGKGMEIVESLAEAIDGDVTVSGSGSGSQESKVRVTFLPSREHHDRAR